MSNNRYEVLLMMKKVRKVITPINLLKGILLLGVFSPQVLAFQLGCRNAVGGLTVYLQAVEVGGCRVSNGVVVRFE